MSVLQLAAKQLIQSTLPDQRKSSFRRRPLEDGFGAPGILIYPTLKSEDECVRSHRVLGYASMPLFINGQIRPLFINFLSTSIKLA